MFTAGRLRGKGLGTDSAAPCAPVLPGWQILAGEVSLPAAVLRDAALQHNLAWMRDFVNAYGVRLAPHGKTTMSPELFAMQLEAGAWGLTLATAPQVRDAAAHGVGRVLMANQLVDRANMAMIADLLQTGTLEFCCLIDSADNADALGAFFAERGLRLRLLLEIGVAGGRSGVRSPEQIESVLAALQRWPQSLALVGVEVYEGVLKDAPAVADLLAHTVQVTQALRAAGAFAEPTLILSGAGSAWYDLVAEAFAELARDPSVCVILRPGCYLTHDVGAYQEADARVRASNPIAARLAGGLEPALQLWACVYSLPEPGRAIVGFGRRDTSGESGMPKAALHFRPGWIEPRPAPAHWQIDKLMDQHAFLSVPEGTDLAVGDLLCFDICHPCLTFDKWRQILRVDEQWKVTGIVHTLF